MRPLSNESVETIPANCKGNDARILPDFTTTSTTLIFNQMI